jgi:hypothetical protein
MRRTKCVSVIAGIVTIILLPGMLTIGNLGPAPVQAAQDPTVQRPISDFLDAARKADAHPSAHEGQEPPRIWTQKPSDRFDFTYV